MMSENAQMNQALEGHHSASTNEHLQSTLKIYLRLQSALAKDDLETAKAELTNWSTHLSSLSSGLMKISGPLNVKIESALKSNEIEKLRETMWEISELMIAWSNQLSNRSKKEKAEDQVSVFFCPMANGTKGARWMQKGSEVRNPFFGKSMVDCGEKVTVLGKEQK